MHVTIKSTTFLCYKTKAICEDQFCLSDRVIGRPTSMLTRCNPTTLEYDACFFLIRPTKESMPSARSYTTSTTYQTRTQSVNLQQILFTLQMLRPKHSFSSLIIWVLPHQRINARPLHMRNAAQHTSLLEGRFAP